MNKIYTFKNGKINGFTTQFLGKVCTADDTHPNWDVLIEALNTNDEELFKKNYNIAETFVSYSEGNVSIVGNKVFYGKVELHGVVVDRMFDFMRNKLDVVPMLKFINKLYQNPSSRAINELYTFLSHKNLPITSDGNFRAYKALMDDYYSVTSGTIELLTGKVREDGRIYNGIGEVIECMRNQVNDDKTDGCSYGLHAGSYEYAKNFYNGKIVEVEINPADVVSIPTDCNCEKLRTCKYVVISESVVPMNDVFVNTEDNNDSDGDDSDGDDDGECDGNGCGCDGCDCEEDNNDCDGCDCEEDNDDCDGCYGCECCDCKKQNDDESYYSQLDADVTDNHAYHDGFYEGCLMGRKNDRRK